MKAYAYHPGFIHDTVIKAGDTFEVDENFVWPTRKIDGKPWCVPHKTRKADLIAAEEAPAGPVIGSKPAKGAPTGKREVLS